MLNENLFNETPNDSLVLLDGHPHTLAFLAGVHILVGLIWMTLYAHLVARAHRTLTRSDVRRWLERVTGVVLIALGLRVALEQR